MIALQINNWNEYRKSREVELNYLKNIQEDILSDSLYFERSWFKRGDKNDSILSCMSTVGIGVITSFLLAGLFEYNFGDSEILILLLFFVTVPYVLKYPREELS